MTKKPDGGPAFPLSRESSFGKNYEGMTLRQWYAGQIRLAMGMWTPEHGVSTFDKSAFEAAERKARAEWCFAEAMIKEGMNDE